ncbi:MAG TPA: Hpt domain-containing protein [Saprospiraceae bacterium]|nr:Hpt domain-containing protein [Saprospiraceae bacterium]
MIDTSLLQTLFEDDGMIRRYLATFRQDVPVTISVIETGIEKEAWENISIEAHSLKSQLQYIREESAAALASQIERKCDQSEGIDVYEIRRLISELEFRLGNIFTKIDAFLEQQAIS